MRMAVSVDAGHVAVTKRMAVSVDADHTAGNMLMKRLLSACSSILCVFMLFECFGNRSCEDGTFGCRNRSRG